MITLGDIGTVTGAGGSLTLNAVNGVPSAAAVIVGVWVGENTPLDVAVTDDAGNSYTNITSTGLDNNPNLFGILATFVAYNVLPLTTAQNIYINSSGGHDLAVTAFYASGVLTTSPIDSSVTATSFGGGSTPLTTSVTSGTASVANELFVGFSAVNVTSDRVTFVQDTSDAAYMAPPDPTNYLVDIIGIGGGSVINPATIALTYAPMWTVSGSDNGGWAAAIIGLIPGTPTPPPYAPALQNQTMILM